MTLPPVPPPIVPDAGHRAGAVTAIGYTASCHREMTPALLSLSLLLRGIAPPDFGRAFTWCELGFGQGVNLAVAAATHPQGRFFGTDVNPEHAAHAADLGRAAGLGNLAVEALDFDAYDRLDLPPFDVVALHGVWSWVGEGPRRRIVEFLRRRLKPGGIAYVSYNALPGWAPYMPLRRLLTAHAAQGAQERPLPERIAAALGFLRRLAREGGYFAVNPAVLPRLEELAERPAAYLAHEFFNEAWTPDYSADVFAALAAADLTFAAPALASDHADALPEGARALLAEVTDPALRETVRDTLTNQPFRRDIFVRGPVPLDPAARDRRLDALPFAALAPARTLPGIARLPQGELPLDRDAGMALLEALADGPASLEALAARSPELAALGQERLRAALVQLHALSRIAPAPGGEAMGAATGADSWNRLVLARSLDGDTLSALASPVLAGGVETDRLERLFLLASVRGEDPAAFAWAVLAARGEAVLRDGRLLEGEAANRAELAERAAAFRRGRLPLLARLGCVPSRT